jgi:nucleoside-diphosphate-sugar epimerase
MEHNVGKKVALIAGVGGMCGSNMAQLLHDTGEWDVIGVSRSSPELGAWVRHVAADLLDPQQTRERLVNIGDVTHIFFTALLTGKTYEEENDLNIRLLRNFLDAALPQIRKLEHIHVLEGVKWYGYHKGDYKTPAREDDPPCSNPPYFYEAQHDYVLKHQQGQSWTWSSTRPGAVCGYGNGARINLMTVIAAYATIMKKLGMPLYFPGDEATYNAITFASDVGMLNRAMLWASTDPRAANQAFNIGNGDSYRWKYMWPRIAAMFDMEPGPVKKMCLVDFMADKEPVWNDLIRHHELKQTDLFRLAPWGYADTVFSRNWDNMISMVKANRFGFTEMIDSEQMMQRIFNEFREQRIIP